MTARPVLVCVDGSAASMRAVHWAAGEAARRNTALRVVHATDRERSEDPLPAAQRLAHQFFPRIEVVTQRQRGEVAEVLLRQSEDARLLVAGSRGVGRPVEALPNSTEAVLAMHSRCPVVVVPDDAISTGEWHGPVVVGVDGSPLSEAAVEFAFDSAGLRGTSLVAVHTWIDVVPETGASGGADDAVQSEQQRVLAERLAGWQEKYPEVATRRLVVRDRPVRVLLEQAECAQLLVVGSRGKGGFTGMLLGSTSTALLYCTPCPLAVVRYPST
jgi:nucleotide-binding universal stress UspA family protein